MNSLLLFAVLCAPAAQDQAKTHLDKTGIRWAASFAEAMDRAKTENRILMIKMIAGGSDASGCW